jgi:predicted amidophosphoribosyltransferase
MSTLLRRCFECGQPLDKKDVFCPRCGARQPREPRKQMDRINCKSCLLDLDVVDVAFPGYPGPLCLQMLKPASPGST